MHSPWWTSSGLVLAALTAAPLACVCGEDGSLVTGLDGRDSSSSRGGGRSAAGGGSSSVGDPSDAGSEPWPSGWGGGEVGGGGGEAQGGGGGQAGGAGDPADAGDAGDAWPVVDAGPGPGPDAGTLAPTCDLTLDSGCQCLHLAILGFSGKDGGADVLRDWLGHEVGATVVSLADATLSPERLAPFQVIVAEDVREGTPGRVGIGAGIGRSYSAEEVDALKQWVSRGGGLVTLIGYTTDLEVANANLLLAPFGLQYGPANGSSNPVTHWASHPITAGVTRVPYDDGHIVRGAGTLIAWEPSQGQYDAARIAELGAGRVFAWGDESIAYPEYLGHPEFQVARLWSNLLGWMVPPSRCPVSVPP